VSDDGRVWSHRRYCAAAEAEIERFIQVVAGADPDLPVPTCPGWTIGDLVVHHGTTHRWVAHVVRTRAATRVWSRDVPVDVPADPAGYPAWLREGAAQLVRTLREAPPAAPMWTVGVDQHARFWPRRVLFEAVVHRADAELTLGRQPRVDPAVALDGVDELLAILPCYDDIAARVADLGHDGASLHLCAHGTGWTVTLVGGGFAWERAPGGGASTVTVESDPTGVLLLAYGRLSADDPALRVTGDTSLLRDWLAATTFD
jgi:uncharacterized protein (TIGR03083 family)